MADLCGNDNKRHRDLIGRQWTSRNGKGNINNTEEALKTQIMRCSNIMKYTAECSVTTWYDLVRHRDMYPNLNQKYKHEIDDALSLVRDALIQVGEPLTSSEAIQRIVAYEPGLYTGKGHAKRLRA